VRGLRTVLTRHFAYLVQVYHHYAALSQAHYHMTDALTAELATDAKILDAAFNKVMLHNLFVLVNKAKSETGIPAGGGLEAPTRLGTGAAASKGKELQREQVLLRFEFIELLVHIAFHKYVEFSNQDKEGQVEASDEPSELASKAHGGPLLGPALERLVVHKLKTNLQDSVSLMDPDGFRRDRLYTENVDQLLSQFVKPLRTVYQLANQVDMEKHGMDLAEWVALLDKCGLVIDEDFTRRDASRCFCLSRFRYLDDLQDLNRGGYHVGFIEFLEALCRVADTKTTPTLASVRKFKCKDPAEIYVAHRTGVLGKKGAMGGNSFANTLDQGDTGNARALHHKLGSFLPIFFQGLLDSGLLESNTQKEKSMLATFRKAVAAWTAMSKGEKS